MFTADKHWSRHWLLYVFHRQHDVCECVLTLFGGGFVWMCSHVRKAALGYYAAGFCGLCGAPLKLGAKSLIMSSIFLIITTQHAHTTNRTNTTTSIEIRHTHQPPHHSPSAPNPNQSLREFLALLIKQYTYSRTFEPRSTTYKSHTHNGLSHHRRWW